MDQIKLTYDTDPVDWSDLAEVYRRAPLGDPGSDKLQRAYENSAACCFAYREAELVGAGRAISDGVNFATVCELVVAPEYQKGGIGRSIMEEDMLERLAVPKVILACVHGQEGLYRKLGFLKHKSVLALYEDSEWFKENGYLE